ncbi:MAG: helix-turn-helix domain-containing protein [Syntrophomonadaceae bacterium]|nr:helix-turn-helix domain-containing protein [Syntrophomonadaceae bacterium]
MDFGETFQKKREEQGYSLEAVEEETKIRKFYLEAIEKENFECLPPRVYATGFVKKYARFIGLDEEEMTEKFKNLAYGNKEETEELDEIPVNPAELERKNFFNFKNIISAAIFLVIAIWLGNYVVSYLTGKTAELPSENRPPVEENTNSEQVKEDKQPQETPNKAQLVIEAKSNCWLYVAVDGAEQFTGILSAGQKKTFEGEESIYIKAGNAGGIEMTFNGTRIEPLGSYGEVKEKTFFALEQDE